jgi:hypothetical protein
MTVDEATIHEAFDRMIAGRVALLEHVGFGNKWMNFRIDDARRRFWILGPSGVTYSMPGDSVLRQVVALVSYGSVDFQSVYRGSVLSMVLTNDGSGMAAMIFETAKEVVDRGWAAP